MGGILSDRITRTTPSEPYRFTSARFVGTLAMLDARGGDKICFGGSSRPVDASKKPSHDQSTPKNRCAAKFLSSSKQFCAPAQAFAKSERALRYAAPTRTSDQAARLYSDVSVRVASFVTFLSNKEMFNRSPLQREKFCKSPVCPQKKVRRSLFPKGFLQKPFEHTHLTPFPKCSKIIVRGFQIVSFESQGYQSRRMT